MNLLEKCVFNITQEIEEYGKERYDDGYKSAEIDMESVVKENFSEGYSNGYEDGKEESEPSEKEMIEFAIEKFKEAGLRSVPFEQILLELESELCKHI